ncbi:multidrug ABC transporter permease/ATP-binding protein [Motilimonas pumila]|uniref:Multidrug ABC transporter permease/ATP-binding protein n=1 Tax=Motilimonas pumila TaxID=2303987 RepID=A0A418Y9N7_9GAMM|nr:multidrug ABC transporter permease/ATP-binding protein [Motilimonas pumila]RJG37979.1 multidrug ABC transporter permease/ATP-binding protein [Motilimonas pumila]
MRLIGLLAANHRLPLCAVILLSLISAVVSVAVIAFIQIKLVASQGELWANLGWFIGLLLLLLISATCAQVALHILGHRFVYHKRLQLVRQLLATDIEQLERLGGAKVLVALNTDVRNITIAFVHLPELVYGAVLCATAFAYLAYLSLPLFFVSLIVIAATAGLGFILVHKISAYIKQVRHYDDELYSNYQAMIDGRKELALSPARAQAFFQEDFHSNALAYRQAVTQADIHNGFAGNLANTLVLGLIGVIFFLAVALEWAPMSVASTFALVILFLRAPLMAAMSAIPVLVAANVSINKLNGMNLASDPEAHSTTATLDAKKAQPDANGVGFQSIRFHNVEYRYQSEADNSFSVGPINLTLERGQLIFIIGGNGSGKSTFARLLTGLYRPQLGHIEIDGQAVNAAKWSEYRQLFSAVFTDFHLFHRILDGHGEQVPQTLVNTWLNRLAMQHKVSANDGRFSHVNYSQGQRKRLALLLAVLEQRGCLLLDEWAADQDPYFRNLFYQDILPLLQQQGITIIAITHDDKYFDQADRILRMDGGQLSELTPAEVQQAQQVVKEVIN